MQRCQFVNDHLMPLHAGLQTAYVQSGGSKWGVRAPALSAWLMRVFVGSSISDFPVRPDPGLAPLPALPAGTLL